MGNRLTSSHHFADTGCEARISVSVEHKSQGLDFLFNLAFGITIILAKSSQTVDPIAANSPC